LVEILAPKGIDMGLDQRFIELYDEYTHRPLARRVFLERLVALAGSAAVAHAVLAALEPGHARAATVADNDPRIVTERVATDTADGRLVGYLARPKEAVHSAGVMVVHENRGLNPHIEDICRRLALEGFVAFGVDFMAPFGGTPADADEARARFAKLNLDVVIPQAHSALAFLKRYPQGNGKAAAMGFCWGGGIVNACAVRLPELDAGVVYYGRPPDLTRVSAIRCPLLLHHAGLDTGVNAGLPAYEAALKAAHVRYSLYIYEGVNHAFNNDTAGERYNEAAAKLAWSRSIAFLRAEVA
jgi:carboxymethylenebutenolidase